MDERGFWKKGCIDENGYLTGTDGEKYSSVCEPGGYKVEYFKIEPVKWRVLEERDGKALILSEDIIGVKEFGVWAKYIISNARDWMHEKFLDYAFTAEQKKIILETQVDNGANSTGYENNPNACGDTYDLLFLLSYEEAKKYLTAEQRIKRPTPYCEALSAYKNDGEWWLRSPAPYDKIYAQYVDKNGGIEKNSSLVFLSYECADTVDSTPDMGIVPAMWIKF